MKQFPTLYKRSKNGEILYWKIWVWTSDHANISKESGRLGTEKPLPHTEPVYEGKNIGKANETTPLQQAESQAQSDWHKKRDEGYKSLEDLGIEQNVNLGGSLEANLQAALPKFNTTSDGSAKPMLATDWKKIKKIDYPVLVQPKLDGVRCLMICSSQPATDGRPGKDYSIRFLSRSGKPYETLSHIAKSLLPYLAHNVRDFILDGEVYSDELSFQSIMRAVKKQRPESEKLHFRAYDVVMDAEQLTRAAEYKELVEQIRSPFVHAVEERVAGTEEEVKAAHDEWVAAGNEGAMIRLFSGKYEQGCRSRSLLKVKEFQEEEFAFLRWEQGQREEDLLAVLETTPHHRLGGSKVEFRAKMVGTREEKVELRKEIPKQITVKYFGLTEDGIPRFPVGKSPRDGE